jgi:hypothetical protein
LDHGLQIIPGLGEDPQFVTLNLGLDRLGPLIPDQLGDLLGQF